MLCSSVVALVLGTLYIHIYVDTYTQFFMCILLYLYIFPYIHISIDVPVHLPIQIYTHTSNCCARILMNRSMSVHASAPLGVWSWDFENNDLSISGRVKVAAPFSAGKPINSWFLLGDSNLCAPTSVAATLNISFWQGTWIAFFDYGKSPMSILNMALPS